MKPKHIALLLGSLTLLLFVMSPSIVNWIEPPKTLGNQVGETAKDIVNGMIGKEKTAEPSKRKLWTDILTITSFLFFIATVFTSVRLVDRKQTRMYGIAASGLAVLGVVVFFSYMAIGLIAVLAILLIALALLNGTDIIP